MIEDGKREKGARSGKEGEINADLHRNSYHSQPLDHHSTCCYLVIVGFVDLVPHAEEVG